MQFPAQRPDLLCRYVNGEIVILDRRQDRIHQLNESAGKVWSLCDGQHTPRHIAEAIMSHYGIPLEQAEADVDTALANLTSLGLLEEAVGIGG